MFGIEGVPELLADAQKLVAHYGWFFLDFSVPFRTTRRSTHNVDYRAIIPNGWPSDPNDYSQRVTIQAPVPHRCLMYAPVTRSAR
jgi:hypothetical protein